jgi:hypothetical protein
VGSSTSHNLTGLHSLLRVHLKAYLTSAIDGVEWSASSSDSLVAREKVTVHFGAKGYNIDFVKKVVFSELL